MHIPGSTASGSVAQADGNFGIYVSPNDLASGIYFYTLHATSLEKKDNFMRTNKMILIK